MRNESPPPIDYQPDASLRAIRRGVRWMVLLTLLNTVMLGTTVAGPAAASFARAQWASYQQWRADLRQLAAKRAARAAIIAAQPAALAYSVPPDALVFAEDLPPGTLPHVGEPPSTRPAPRGAGTSGAPAAADPPACLAPLDDRVHFDHPRPTYGYLFVHGRRATPTGTESLVVCFVDAQDSAVRRFSVATYVPATPDADISLDGFNGWELDDHRPGKPPLRLFAGQPDPFDAARFTVAYELGDGRGTIAGRLDATGHVSLTADGPLAASFREWTK